MWQLTFAALRGHTIRFVAGACAVMLGVAFMTAALATLGSTKAGLSDAVGAAYAHADLVVRRSPDAVSANLPPTLPAKVVDGIRRTTGVRAAAGLVTSDIQVSYSGTGATTWAQASNLPVVPTLRSQRVTAGRLPQRLDEVAVDGQTAADRRLRIGSSLSVRSPGGTGRETLRIVGLLGDRSLPPGAVFVGTDATLAHLTGTDHAIRYDEVLVSADPGVDLGRLGARLAEVTSGAEATRKAEPTNTSGSDGASGAGAGAGAESGLLVQSAADRIRDRLTDLTGSVNVLGGFILGFAVIAIFVATLVVANTFRILVAQRTRELALLRCIGARRGQVFRSMLGESAILGAVASVFGLGVGAALAAVTAALLPYSALRLPRGSLHLDAVTIGVPLVVGVVTTVAAAMIPAHRATRVPPLAALRPELAVRMRSRTGALRAAASLLLLAGGGALVWAGTQAGMGPGLAYGIVGGLLSFLGIVLIGPLVTPRLVELVGLPAVLLAGTPARLATVNARRNPGRTATTATALLVGVTLISLMSVGAASVQRSVHGTLDKQYPLDLEVRPATSDAQERGIPAGVLGSVRGTSGLTAVIDVRKPAGKVTVQSIGRAGHIAPARQLDVLGVDPADGRRVLHDSAPVQGLRDGTAVVPQTTAKDRGLSDGSEVRMNYAGRRLDLRVHVVPMAPGPEVLVTTADLRRLAPVAPVAALWARMTTTADAGAVVADIQRALPAAADLSVEGAAPMRAQYDQLLDVLLLVATALLAVAVVIALVGVGNTLSLSVVERIREQALLRALGLTVGQLRAMLAVEALLITAAAAVLGVALGIGYGMAGTTILLGSATEQVSFSVPVGRLLVVGGVALVAGLAASVLPARRAVRVQPAAALSEE